MFGTGGGGGGGMYLLSAQKIAQFLVLESVKNSALNKRKAVKPRVATDAIGSIPAVTGTSTAPPSNRSISLSAAAAVAIHSGGPGTLNRFTATPCTLFCTRGPHLASGNPAVHTSYVALSSLHSCSLLSGRGLDQNSKR